MFTWSADSSSIEADSISPPYVRAVPIAALSVASWKERIEAVRKASRKDLAKYQQAKVELIKAAAQKNEIDEPEESWHLPRDERRARSHQAKEAYEKAHAHAREIRRTVWHRLEVRLARKFAPELLELLKLDLEKDRQTNAATSSLEEYDASTFQSFIRTLNNIPPKESPDYLWRQGSHDQSIFSNQWRHIVEESPYQADQRRLARLAAWDKVANAEGESPPKHWRLFGFRSRPVSHTSSDAIPTETDSSSFSIPAPYTQVDRMRSIWAETAYPRITQPEILAQSTQKPPTLPHIHSVIEELMGDRGQSETITWADLVDPNTTKTFAWEEITRGSNREISR